MQNLNMAVFSQSYAERHKERFEKTLTFMHNYAPPPSSILDLGTVNPFSDVMIKAGYLVTNTDSGVDLDVDFEIVKQPGFDMVTAFEIFEHMVSPFTLLRDIAAPVLIASVPLRLWFAEAYWNEADPFDRHYHEFEPRQFDMLLGKAGWFIHAREKWISPPETFGIRPLFRYFTPRYYIVYATRKT